MSTTRAALRESFSFDARLVAPVVGVITALPVVGLFAVGLAAFTPRDAISMAVGANLIAVVSLVGAPKLSLPTALIDAGAMAVAVFVGVSTTSITWLHVALMVPLCFAAGYATIFGLTPGVIGTQAIIAYVVLGRFAGAPATGLHLALLVVIGALIEVGALVVLRLPPSLRFQRFQLGAAIDAVAELARSEPGRSATEFLGAVDDAERALAAPSLFGRDDTRSLRAVLDQLRRSRLELTTVAGLRVRLRGLGGEGDGVVFERCAASLAAALDELAVALRQPSRSTWREAEGAYRATIDTPALSHPTADGASLLWDQCGAHLRALDGQVRAMGQLVDDLGAAETGHAWRARIPRIGPLEAAEHTDRSLIRENFRVEAPAFRHGVRLAIAVPLSAVLAAWWNLPRGYWIPFAVAVILKPDYSTLLRRGVGRVFGTAVGASLAALLVTALHPNAATTTVLVGVLAWAAYSTWSASFSVAIGFVTALILVLLSVSQTNPGSTALDRLVDVALGAALSVLVYVLWPTSPRAGVSDALAGLFAALGSYLAVVAPAVQGSTPDSALLRDTSRAARVAWGHAEEAVGRSVEEPTSTRINPDEGRGQLAVAMRILRATHALRIEAEHGATADGSPELDTLIEGCSAALATLSRHFAEGSDAHWADLRPLYLAVQDRLARDGAAASITLHCDEVVNALNTAAHLIAVSASPAV